MTGPAAAACGPPRGHTPSETKETGMSTEKAPDLYLHEQVLLLALRDERGTVESRAGWYSLAMGGAILAELLLAGCVSVGEDKKKLVDVVQSRRLDDPLLDECLRLVGKAKRRRSAAGWVSGFAHVKRLRHRVALKLCRKGILKDSEEKVLLLFTRKVYPTVDPAPERRLSQALHRAIFQDSKNVNPRTAILVALAHSTGLLNAVFERGDLKRRKRRLEQISDGELIGGAANAAVQAAKAAQAAAMAAISAATVVTTTAGR
jgi:hypothetical protein